MSIISIIENLEIKLGLDKILTYFQDRSKDREKREYLELIRHYKDLADDFKREKLTEPAEICLQRASSLKRL